MNSRVIWHFRKAGEVWNITHMRVRENDCENVKLLNGIYILRRYYNGRMCKEKKQTVMVYSTRKSKCRLPLRVWYYIAYIYSRYTEAAAWRRTDTMKIHYLRSNTRYNDKTIFDRRWWWEIFLNSKKLLHASAEVVNFTANYWYANYFYNSLWTGPIIAFNYKY